MVGRSVLFVVCHSLASTIRKYLTLTLVSGLPFPSIDDSEIPNPNLVSGLPFPSIDDSEDTYTWKVLDADNSTHVRDELNGQIGKSIEFTPTMTDSGSVFGISVIRSDSSGTELSSSKYVRLGCMLFNLVYA